MIAEAKFDPEISGEHGGRRHRLISVRGGTVRQGAFVLAQVIAAVVIWSAYASYMPQPWPKSLACITLVIAVGLGGLADLDHSAVYAVTAGLLAVGAVLAFGFPLLAAMAAQGFALWAGVAVLRGNTSSTARG